MIACVKWIGCLAVVVPFLFAPAARAADGKSGEEEEETEEANKPDADQPKYTAGALFTRATYPLNEVERPLKITGGMGEGRLDFLTDIANGHSLKTFVCASPAASAGPPHAI